MADPRALAVTTLATARGFLARPVNAVIVVVAFALGSLAGAPVEEAVYHYMWADPGFCDDCHVHDYANAAYERSVHAGLTTCHDCHLVPIRHYPRNLFVTVTEGELSVDEMHAPEVASVICTRCHSEQADDEPLTGPMPEDVRERIVKIDHSPLHLAHMGARTRTPSAMRGGTPESPVPDRDEPLATGHGTIRPDWDAGHIACMDCHGSENNRAHEFEASRENCVACHEGTNLPEALAGNVQCRECHFDGFVGRPGIPAAAP